MSPISRKVIRPLAQWLFAVMLCSGVSGCGTVTYYAQAIQGQAEILRKARPVAAVMRDSRTPGETKRQLALVQELRTFARERLGLPADRLYDRYSDLGRDHVSWVVYAAPEFSVEGKTWEYPLLGKLEYRGFFSKEAAQNEATRLRAQGYEVHIAGVDAYSTLGWFRDPVLSTFLRRGDSQIAELIFHELTHVRTFRPGDTDFNEALATANAQEGVRRWLTAAGDRRALGRYEAGLSKDREVVRLLLETREKLDRLYRNNFRSPERMRREKDAAFRRMGAHYARIRPQGRDDSRHDPPLAIPWNNARLNTVATYYELVPGFERLLNEQHGDLEEFYATVEAARRLTNAERRTLLNRSRVERNDSKD